MIIKRELRTAIENLRTKYPILAITGPRQSGKTTFLKNTFSDYTYVNLEDPDNRNFAETDPRNFLSQYNKYVIFDEVQRVPHLFSYIQGVVDESGLMGQFILSGSQNFHLMQNITQSLAGRVAIFRLFPFDFQELNSVGLLNERYEEYLLKGFYPAIYDRNILPTDYYSNYVETYVQRDVSELIAIHNLNLFQKFLTLSATRAGQLLNLSSLAKECGITQPTARAWLSALENSYIVFLLYPFHKNFSKRVVKTPKLYFYDVGLLSYLLKIKDTAVIGSHSIKGSLFENMIIAEYVKRLSHKSEKQTNIWFWRNSDGNEVDLIIQKSMQDEIVEIKATETIMSDLFKGLNRYASLETETKLKKTLVYGGNTGQQRSAAEVVPWKEFGK